MIFLSSLFSLGVGWFRLESLLLLLLLLLLCPPRDIELVYPPPFESALSLSLCCWLLNNSSLALLLAFEELISRSVAGF